jgi:hypothetical protein
MMWRSALVLLLAISASCMDPVQSDRVDALGPEVNGVRTGPLHRPGQPCTTCHGAAGPGSPEFSIAGTVYATREGAEVAPNIDVVVSAADGRTLTLRTNEAGNFYVDRDKWDAPFPMHVKLVQGDVTKEMETRIGGDGGCAVCHRSPVDASHMPHVYLRDK